MSAHSSGVEAYRSTVKWLVAFVPTATVTAAAIAAGPAFAERVADEGLVDALVSWTLLGVVLIGAGIVAIVATGLRVLSTQTDDLARLPPDVVDRAFGAGIGAPHFTDSETYRETAQAVQSWVDHQRRPHDGEAGSGPPPTGATPVKPDDGDLEALGAAEAAVRDWTLHVRTADAFRHFLYAFWASAVAMLVGLMVVVGDQAARDEPRDPPEPVSVDMTADRLDELIDVTGCELESMDDLELVSFWLVAGEYSDPVLQVDGDGCAIDRDWKPGDGVRVRPMSD